MVAVDQREIKRAGRKKQQHDHLYKVTQGAGRQQLHTPATCLTKCLDLIEPVSY